MTLHFGDRRGAAQLRSVTEIAPKITVLKCVGKTEAISGMVFVPAQKPSGIV